MAPGDNIVINRRYTKSHEWIRVDGNIGTIGITDHAQKEVTDVVYVEMAKVGKALKAGEEATTLESVKAAFSIYAPVAGTITKVNNALEGDPGLINRSPYEDGWIFALDLANPADVNNLMTESQYEDFVKSGASSAHN
jgi:glycine cleavage system H protein